MIWTSFFLSSFISIVSEFEKNSSGGKKKSSFKLLFGPPKMAKNARQATNLLPAGQSACDCLECPHVARDMSNLPCGFVDILQGPLLPLQG